MRTPRSQDPFRNRRDGQAWDLDDALVLFQSTNTAPHPPSHALVRDAQRSRGVPVRSSAALCPGLAALPGQVAVTSPWLTVNALAAQPADTLARFPRYKPVRSVSGVHTHWPYAPSVASEGQPVSGPAGRMQQQFAQQTRTDRACTVACVLR